jgi:hypothetical protein
MFLFPLSFSFSFSSFHPNNPITLPGWSSSALLVQSSVVTSLLTSHATINPGTDRRNHMAFYKALGGLLLNVFSDQASFYAFVRPWEEMFKRLEVGREGEG